MILPEGQNDHDDGFLVHMPPEHEGTEATDHGSPDAKPGGVGVLP